MTQFVGFAGNTEQQLRQWFSYLVAQDSVGVAKDGVLAGLGVSQTGTASASVVIGKGEGVVQDTGLAGAIPLGLDSDLTLDVLTANPVGGLPRNDLVVYDSATVSGGSGGVRVIVGTPNASPTDPTVPATAVPLARLRHAASATTVPTAKIDDLRVTTGLAPSVQPAWVAYTPVWTADTTPPSVGNGSVTGRYKVGNDGMVDAVIVLKMGTSGVAQGSGSYALTLPVAADLTEPFALGGSAQYVAGGTNYLMTPAPLDSTHVRMVANGFAGVWRYDLPTAITTSASLRVQLRYKKA